MSISDSNYYQQSSTYQGACYYNMNMSVPKHIKSSLAIVFGFGELAQASRLPFCFSQL
jgi:hypothetical protein